ncbi:DUF3471 domain-containing protein [Salinimicrobium soli]|uniref:DUF3471 domain-containing protein n=1 Tax=Salinimicrobium soli TaxID=1254399 RepID=UPI003AACBF3F
MRKTTFLGLGLAALTLLSCKEEKSSVSTSSTVVSSEALNPQKIDELGDRYNELGRFSGSILVAEDGEVVYTEFFGMAEYEKNRSFSEETTFSLGPVSNFMLHDSGKQIQNKKMADSLAVESEKALTVLIKELELQNTFLQDTAPKNAATGYVHSIGPNGPEIQPVTPTGEKQLWTTAKDLGKILAEIADDKLIQDGYLEAGGFSYAIRKNNDLTVLVLSNRRHPVAAEMANSIEQLWKREGYQLPLLRKEIEVSPSLLNTYAGTYELGPGAELEVISEKDSLFLMMGPQKIHLKPQSENQFFMDNSEAAIRFEKDSTGTVASAVLLDGFLEGNSIPKK